MTGFIWLTNEDLYKNIGKYDIQTLELNFLNDKIDLINIMRTQNIDYNFCFNYVINNNRSRLTIPEITYLQPHLNRQTIIDYIDKIRNNL
jgi:hypothetical protein